MTTLPNAAVNSDAMTGEREIRFAFGKNWQRFLQHLNDDRIAEAEKSLRFMLHVEDLKGKSFLDIGCGSGLFSLAAMRLGAGKVFSFDYDPQSVACAQELRRRYFPGSDHWTIEQGSALDTSYLNRLGQFDVVYSWGVLHHTGSMWQALENVVAPVQPEGKLFIAIYNDQGRRSVWWRKIKQLYCRSVFRRVPIIGLFGFYVIVAGFIKDVFIVRRNPLVRYREYKLNRGMSYFTDVLDWLGGYPYEVARPEAIFDFYRTRGFELVKLKTDQRFANNEFVFLKRNVSTSDELRP